MSQGDCPIPKAEVPWGATKHETGCSGAVTRGVGRLGTADEADVL